jgi:hypothetical protein
MSGAKLLVLLAIAAGAIAVVVTMNGPEEGTADQAAPPEPGSPQSLTRGDTIHGQIRVYVPRNGRYYHRRDCPEIDSLNAVPMALPKAAALHEPCPVCNPPTDGDASP